MHIEIEYKVNGNAQQQYNSIFYTKQNNKILNTI